MEDSSVLALYTNAGRTALLQQVFGTPAPEVNSGYAIDILAQDQSPSIL